MYNSSIRDNTYELTYTYMYMYTCLYVLSLVVFSTTIIIIIGTNSIIIIYYHSIFPWPIIHVTIVVYHFTLSVFEIEIKFSCVFIALDCFKGSVAMTL